MAFQPPNEYDGYDPYDGYNRQGRGGRNHHHNHRNNYGGNRGRGRGRGRGARGYKGRPHYNKKPTTYRGKHNRSNHYGNRHRGGFNQHYDSHNRYNATDPTEKVQNRNGFIEWRVNANLLQQFKLAKHKQEFLSPQFGTIDGSIWRINFYPRGDQSPDECSIFVECVQLNGDKQCIGINFSFNIVELDWCCDGGNTIRSDGHAAGIMNAFKSEQLNHLEVLTIKCCVEETMDVRDANTYFEWKASNDLMSKWKNAKFKKSFRSPDFNAIGAKWCMQIYPNGWETEGIADLSIWCKSIESDEKENVSCSYYIGIESLNYYQTNFNEITLKEREYIVYNSPFKWRDIQNLSEITICVKVWRTGSIDANEAQLIANLYSEKMMKLRNELSVGAIARVQKENEALRREME
eukprot:91200_1